MTLWIVLAGCGGGDGGSVQPVLQPSQQLAKQCVAPRPAGEIDPFPNMPYNDRPGTAATEKAWVRSFIDETYLWYDEVPNYDAAGFASARDYFDVLKTQATTASGKPKDQFHFWIPTDEFIASTLASQQIGYGMELVGVGNRYLIAFTEPGSPAAASSLARGAELLAIDGVPVASVSPAAFDRAIFPPVSGEAHTFTFRDRGASVNRNVALTSATITRTSVQNPTLLQTNTGDVGYFVFNDHDANSEAQLVNAVNALKAAGPVSDLVIDIRYNGGGFLDIAAELGYMVAGAARTNGKTFEHMVFNRKMPFGNVADTPFHATTQNFSLAAGQPLPQLGLPRVFVLTSSNTCSASESIINGLRGVGVQVVQIGTTTCGKPYGFFPEDNCSTTYFTAQFQGVNQQGFGDYPDGFVPGGSGPSGVPGCVVNDDLTHDLGDPAEARLQAALAVRGGGACPAAAARDAPQALGASAPHVRMMRGPLRENRFARR